MPKLTMLLPAKNAIRLLIIGGLVVDDIAICVENISLGSSNPVRWHHRLGGVASNVARVAAQQVDTLLIANAGDDHYAQELAELLEQQSVSVNLCVWPDQHSDRYTAVVSPAGELFVGLADTHLAEKMRWGDIQTRLPPWQPDAIVFDANLSADCLQESINALSTHYEKHTPIYALAVSPAKSVRWLSVADKLDLFVCNRREAAALSGLDWQSDIHRLADALMQQGFRCFVITDGSAPLLVQEQDTRSMIPVPRIDIKKNVNGAGDAMAGATFAQRLQGHALVQAISDSGMTAAHAVLAGKAESPLL